MAIAVGEQIGDYEVLARLGAGGIGEVYKVRHLISHRTEALKILLRDRLDGNQVERFIRESRVVASLSHPHIAALHTAFRHDNQMAMIMEYVDGATLSSRIPGLSIRQGMAYIGQVLSALQFAHERGVIHRDIKSSNIMITTEDSVKLLDFGLAVTGGDPKLTRSGFVLGSLHYMSPEQIMGDVSLDGRSDLYSVGITLYETITRTLPITGSSDYAILSGHMHQTPRPPAEVNPAVSAELSRAVMKALAKRPEDRFQTAQEFLRALEAGSGQAACLEEDSALSRTRTAFVTRAAVSPFPEHQGSGSGSSPHVSGVTPVPTQSPVSETRASSGAPKASPTAAQLEEISRELAVYVGPIAKILVKRAASQHSTLTELYAALGMEIESAKDRDRFLASRRKSATGKTSN